MEIMKAKTTLMLVVYLISFGMLKAQSTDFIYKEKWNSRYAATIYFSSKTGAPDISPEEFFNYENIYFTIRPNAQSEKPFFKEKDTEDYFSQVRLFQHDDQVAPAEPPVNITNADGKMDRVLLAFQKRDVKLYKPITFISPLDTTEAITLDDSYFLYYNKYQPIYTEAMEYSDRLEYINTFNAVMEILVDASNHQEIKHYSFYNNASEVLIGNAIRQHADSLDHLLEITENQFRQSFSKKDLAKIDSVVTLVEDAAELFKPYFKMDFPKSRAFAEQFDALLVKSEKVSKRNHEHYQSNKLNFFRQEDYTSYKFGFYVDLLARMITQLDTLTMIDKLDTLNMAQLDGMPDAKKELMLTGWEKDFTTIVRMLNKEIAESGRIFNDSIMDNLQQLKKFEKQPYQQIFLAFNALSEKKMLFENFLKNALGTCSDEELIANMEMWLLSYNLTFAGLSETTAANINSGIKLIEQKRWEEAANNFNIITRQANTIAPPWFYWGLSLYEQEQPFAADAKFDLALGIYPDYIAPRLFKFRILHEQENFEKLLSQVDAALQVNDIWLFHYWRAKALYALEDFPAAIDELEEFCLKMNPYEPDEYFLLGDTYAAVKNFDLAEEAYAKTQEINPHDFDDRFNDRMMKLQEARRSE